MVKLQKTMAEATEKFEASLGEATSSEELKGMIPYFFWKFWRQRLAEAKPCLAVVENALSAQEAVDIKADLESAMKTNNKLGEAQTAMAFQVEQAKEAIADGLR